MRTTAMIDSGATSLFINKTFAENHKVLLHELSYLINVHNIDGAPNQAGAMTHCT